MAFPAQPVFHQSAQLCQSAAELESAAQRGLEQQFQPQYCCSESGLSNRVILCHINNSLACNHTHTKKVSPPYSKERLLSFFLFNLIQETMLPKTAQIKAHKLGHH